MVTGAHAIIFTRDPEGVRAFFRDVLGFASVDAGGGWIRGHTRLTHRRGASEQEIMEAIRVAAEMRAGGGYAHSVLALDALGAAANGHTPGDSGG